MLGLLVYVVPEAEIKNISIDARAVTRILFKTTQTELPKPFGLTDFVRSRVGYCL